MLERTLYLSLCLLGSLALAGCGLGSWEPAESSSSRGVQVEQGLSFASHDGSAVSPEREDGDPVRVLREPPPPEAKTPCERESSSRGEERSPVSPVERERAEDQETSSTSSRSQE